MRWIPFSSDFRVSQALPKDVRGNVLESQTIMREFPKVVPENLFVQIPEEMERFDADVSALELALEQAPEIFKSVGVNLSVNVRLRMVYDLMLEPLVLESLIGHECIGVDRAACLDVCADVGLEQVLFAIADDRSANLAATLKDALNCDFILGASLCNPALALVRVHETGGTTDESLIYFDFLTLTAKLDGGTGLHRKPDALKHKPCGLLSDAEGSAYFVGTDSVLAVGKHPHGDEPLIERQGGIFKNGSNLHAELLAGMLSLAFPHPASGDETNVIAATGGADDLAIRPAALDHEVEAVVGVREIDDGLLESLWLGTHGVPHKNNYPINAFLSQVYYCPSKKHGVGEGHT